MKRAIWILPVLALVLAVPALSQDGGDADNADLAGEVAKLKKLVAEQQKVLKETQSYLLTMKGEASLLAKALKKADKGGFTMPAPNNDAKSALLKGLQRYATVGATGKAPTSGN